LLIVNVGRNACAVRTPESARGYSLVFFILLALEMASPAAVGVLAFLKLLACDTTELLWQAVLVEDLAEPNVI